MSGGVVYKGIGPEAGKKVPAAEAFRYVLERVGILAFDPTAPEFEEFKELLVEWYFSGNWIKTEESEEE